MQQARFMSDIVLSIQELNGESKVKLTTSGNGGVALYLGVQQAREMACDLIQHAYRLEVSNSLKMAKDKASQSTADHNESRMAFFDVDKMSIDWSA